MINYNKNKTTITNINYELAFVLPTTLYLL